MDNDASACGPLGRFWVRSEYLLWWNKGISAPPLITTSPTGTPLAVAGLLGQPTTSILYGGDQSNSELRSGGRFTAGMWLNESQTVGIQARFFFLETEADQFAVASTGLPILMIPFFDPSGAQKRFVTAFPGTASGAVRIDTSSRFYGGDINMLVNMCCNCNCRLDGLIGWRTLRLNEEFNLVDQETNLGQTVMPRDQFRTSNQFNGLDLGLSGEYRQGRFFVDFLTKVAVGANRQGADITGTSIVNGSNFQGGLFALSSNIGAYSRTLLTVAPEVNVNVGMQLTKNLRVTTGYSFLYLTNVVRPGDQIDTTINPNLLPPTSGAGPQRPAFQFHGTDFWTQGVNFGMELRW